MEHGPAQRVDARREQRVAEDADADADAKRIDAQRDRDRHDRHVQRARRTGRPRLAVEAQLAELGEVSRVGQADVAIVEDGPVRVGRQHENEGRDEGERDAQGQREQCRDLRRRPAL